MEQQARPTASPGASVDFKIVNFTPDSVTPLTGEVEVAGAEVSAATACLAAKILERRTPATVRQRILEIRHHLTLGERYYPSHFRADALMSLILIFG